MGGKEDTPEDYGVEGCRSATEIWSDAKGARAGLQQLDPWTAWAYKPHTLTALCLGACALVYWSGPLGIEEQADTVQNARAGVIAMIAVFLGYCILQAPDTILIRPHPALWRLVHGLAVVYMVALTFLLFQNRSDARLLLRHLSPELGHELPERSYGVDCRVYTPEHSNKFRNIWAVLNDEFVIAHILGWWGKTIMIRNYFLCWVLSIMFEIMEVTFHHMLPNFNECWWDSIIVDVFICNWFGIWLGMKTVNHFDGKKYSWVGLSQQPSFMAKFWRSLGQFMPASWDRDTWNPMSGPKRFVQVLALVIVVLIVEVNAFFLKFCLWVPPRNLLNTYRLVLWWLIANPAIREYNHFLTHSEIKKLGAFCWLSLANCILEVLVCVKFGRGLYQEPMPVLVKWFWIVATLSVCTFLLGWVVQDYRRATAEKSHRKRKGL